MWPMIEVPARTLTVRRGTGKQIGSDSKYHEEAEDADVRLILVVQDGCGQRWGVNCAHTVCRQGKAPRTATLG
jgi:hypothetical protein